MAKERKAKKGVLPIVGSSHLKEDDSRQLFQKLVKHWMIINWFVKDYGIDANIEISKSFIQDRQKIATGKRFSLQIKSSTSISSGKGVIALSIPKSKIIYWYNSLEPVMLAFADLKLELIYYLWVDDKFLNNLTNQNSNWIAQDSVKIKFDPKKTISNGALNEIEKYVFNWRRPSKTILSPGNYFRFSQEAREVCQALNDLVARHKIPFLKEELNDLIADVTRSIYTIAIVGPSRVGKSTLINALLHKQISPVDILPTTGVPITILPFNENKITVLFKDGKNLEGSVDSEFLNQYTSQQKNPGNLKGVKFVSVNIINQQLEKGLALCDVPGLDDPDDEIRNITKSALYNVNAIIYVMSVASFNDGEFCITKQNIDDLNHLGGRMDRIFLVFNKVDKLSEPDMPIVEGYISEQLQKFDIARYLPAAPFFISSKASLRNRVEGGSLDDSVSGLEKAIWKFLLDSNKTGLHKIMSGLTNSRVIIEKIKHTINARLVSSERRKEIESELNQVRREIGSIRAFVSDERKRMVDEFSNLLNNSFENILIGLENQLHGISILQPLPKKDQITSFLEKYAFQTISDINSSFQQSIYVLQSKINNWISDKLKQVEIAIERGDSDTEEGTDPLDTPDIAKYTGQIFSIFQDKGTGYIGILESIFAGIVGGIAWIFTSIGDVFTSNEKLRKRDIKNIMSKSKKGYQKIVDDFLGALNKAITSNCRRMEEQSLDRTKVYLGDLKNQLDSLDVTLDRTTHLAYNKFLEEADKLEQLIQSHLTQLKDYTDGIDWN